MEELTIGIVKPHAYGHRPEIERMILNAGMKIEAKLDPYSVPEKQAETFYAVHKFKPFFRGLVNSLREGPVDIMLIKGDYAVENMRKLAGPVDPAKASLGSIRGRFGLNIANNAVHFSDYSAKEEVALFFGEAGIREYASQMQKLMKGLHVS